MGLEVVVQNKIYSDGHIILKVYANRDISFVFLNDRYYLCGYDPTLILGKSKLGISIIK